MKETNNTPFLEKATATLGLLLTIGLISIWGCKFDRWLDSQKNETAVAGQAINIINDGEVCMDDEMTTCTEAWIMVGAVNSAMTHALNATLAEHGATKPFCLMSGGGNVEEAAIMASMLEQHKATTCLGKRYLINDSVFSMSTTDIHGDTVTGNLCMSACPIILAGGAQRIAYGDAKVGVHNMRRYLDFCLCKIPLTSPSEMPDAEKIAGLLETLSDDSSSRIRKLQQWGQAIDSNNIRFLSDDEIRSIVLITDYKIVQS